MKVEALRNILEHPLLRDVHARKRADIKERFPQLRESSHDRYISIHKYIRKVP